jgi:hypothetical protein
MAPSFHLEARNVVRDAAAAACGSTVDASHVADRLRVVTRDFYERQVGAALRGRALLMPERAGRSC